MAVEVRSSLVIIVSPLSGYPFAKVCIFYSIYPANWRERGAQTSLFILQYEKGSFAQMRTIRRAAVGRAFAIKAKSKRENKFRSPTNDRLDAFKVNFMFVWLSAQNVKM